MSELPFDHFNITDTENVRILAEMIAAETAGSSMASVEQEDVELAVIVASHIKQLVHETYSGCIVRGTNRRVRY